MAAIQHVKFSWLLLLAFFLSVGCASKSIVQDMPQSSPGLMPDTFWGKGDNSDLPNLFEAVCSFDPDECGDTHFEGNDDLFVVSFQRFATTEAAIKALDRERRNSFLELRAGEIKALNGDVVGKKFVLQDDIENHDGRYKLAWVRGNRLASVTARKLDSITAYEADRGL